MQNIYIFFCNLTQYHSAGLRNSNLSANFATNNVASTY